MNEDILADWKESRYIVAGAPLTDDGISLIILTDLKFWSDHSDELHQWCSEHNAAPEGLTVPIYSEELLTAFHLRWA